MSQYLIDHEKLRLRAERGEDQARRWRVTAYVLLVLLVAQTWLVIDTALSLANAREHTAMADADAYRHSSLAAEIDDRRLSAERKFKTCVAANAGLVDGIKEQQALLNEAIEMAKRCRV